MQYHGIRTTSSGIDRKTLIELDSPDSAASTESLLQNYAVPAAEVHEPVIGNQVQRIENNVNRDRIERNERRQDIRSAFRTRGPRQGDVPRRRQPRHQRADRRRRERHVA